MIDGIPLFIDPKKVGKGAKSVAFREAYVKQRLESLLGNKRALRIGGKATTPYGEHSGIAMEVIEIRETTVVLRYKANSDDTIELPLSDVYDFYDYTEVFYMGLAEEQIYHPELPQ